MNLADGLLYIGNSLSAATAYGSAVAFASQGQNLVWASPSTTSGIGRFRVLVADDLGVNLPHDACGRLSLSSSLPLSDADITGAATLYYVPYNGNRITLWNSVYSSYELVPFVTSGFSLSSFGAGVVVDVYITNNNNGTTTFGYSQWTSATVRAVTPYAQDGMYFLNSGAGLVSRLVGTVMTSGSGVGEDSATRRYVWNAYNQVPRRLTRICPTNSWNTPASGTNPVGNYYRWLAGSQANSQVDFVVGGLGGSTGFAQMSWWTTTQGNPSASSFVVSCNAVLLNASSAAAPPTRSRIRSPRRRPRRA